jgi:glycosyltransferase involved in cell wall biosynthesis
MSYPLVSVIMPVYNASAFLSATIECILQQTYQNWELIIINDGSKDNSEDIIKQFSDSRIRYFLQENQGQCAASNFGITQAKGDYIKFFDADDIMNSTHIEAQVKRLNGGTTAIASCAWGRFYDDDPNSAKFIPEPVWKDMKPLDWLKTSLKQRADMMAAWLWLIPRQVIEKTGGWDKRLSLNNDFEFSVRLLLACEEILFVPEAKVYYRTGGQTLSASVSKKAYEDAYLSTYLGCTYLLEKDSSAEMKRICSNRYQEWMYRMYPEHPELLRKYQQQVEALGGSDIKLEGGVILRTMSSVIGWKPAKRFKLRLNSWLR